MGMILNVVLKHPNAQPLAYATSGASGMDITAIETAIIEPGESKAVRTGIAVSVSDGFEIQVRPRSGLAFKHGITVLNTPGTIDADYRGELMVLLFNTGKEKFVVAPGDRIAQLVCAKVEYPRIEYVDKLSETERGEKGLGSTGIKSINFKKETNFEKTSTGTNRVRQFNIRSLYQGMVPVPSTVIDEVLANRSGLLVRLNSEEGVKEMLLSGEKLKNPANKSKKTFKENLTGEDYILFYYQFVENV